MTFEEWFDSNSFGIPIECFPYMKLAWEASEDHTWEKAWDYYLSGGNHGL